MPDLKQRIGQWLGFGLMSEAARPLTRERTWLHATATDSRQDVDAYDRLRLLALSRRLFINNPIVRAAVNEMARYSVGPGIRPQARSSDESWNRRAEEYFNAFAESADVRGMLDFYELQSLTSQAIDRDGDVFLILTQTKDGRPALQVVEAHRCGTPQGADQKLVIDGVQADATGRPLKYFFSNDPANKIFKAINADSVLHLFEPDRPDQFRGYPRTAVALIPMLDRDEVLRMEMQGLKAATSLGMVITNNTGSAQGGFFGTPTHNSGDAVTSETIYSGGGIARLKPGESVQTFSLSRPNEKLDAFLDQYIRAAAIGMGLPYEFIWNSERLAGTAQRFTLAKAQRRFEERQRLLIAKLCAPVWRYVIAAGIESGELPRNAEWRSVIWQTPRKLTVDAGRESQAIREEYKLGFTNLADVIGAEGSDWQEVINQKISETRWIQERCREEGIDPSSIQLLTPNGNLNPATAAPVPQPDPALAQPTVTVTMGAPAAAEVLAQPEIEQPKQDVAPASVLETCKADETKVTATEAFTMPDTPDYTLTKKEENMVLRAIGLMPKPAKKKKKSAA
jgi:lambda family phage portal protein